MLKQKIAVVTGAGKPDGIGFAACRKLLAAGAKVVVTDLPEMESELSQRVHELKSLGGQAMACTLDVTDSDQLGKMLDSVCDVYGGIDIVFNNAGYPGGNGDFLDINNEIWMHSWNVNVMGIVNMCRKIIPIMQTRGGGSIINNSSLSGLGVEPQLSAYSATKYAVVALTKSIAIEHGGDNIRANAVCPGLVATQMGQLVVDIYKQHGDSYDSSKERLAQQVPLGQRWATADEIGDAVVFLAGPHSSYITGVSLPVAGGLVAGLA